MTTPAPEAGPPIAGVMDAEVLIALLNAINANLEERCYRTVEPRGLFEHLTRANLSVVRTGSDGKTAGLAEALRGSVELIDDLLCVHVAPDEVDPERRDEARRRVMYVGTLACIATAQSNSRAALAAYDSPPSPSPVDGWQPIASFPNTPNLEVDLYADNHRYTDCHFHCNEWFRWDGDPEIGWLKIEAPSHWRPLPPPPVRTQEESAAALTGTHVEGE